MGNATPQNKQDEKDCDPFKFQIPALFYKIQYAQWDGKYEKAMMASDPAIVASKDGFSAKQI
tara:strand:+ start:84 stop:269 length:186 start_codon:yes stop_codon:yes gene_type:complete